MSTLDERVSADRERSGVPPRVTDAEALRRIAVVTDPRAAAESVRPAERGTAA